MSDGRPSGTFAAAAARRWLGVTALLALGAAWLGLLRLATPEGQPGGGDQDGEYRRELLSYVSGLVLAVALTGAAFAMVHWSLATHFSLEVAIGVLALTQIVVHFRCFLHVDFSKQKREDLELILFSTLILVLMVAGTIWIMTNLAARMM